MELVQRVDEYGKPAWIGLMIISFILFWPAGLALLFYIIWSGRMGCSKHKRRWSWSHGTDGYSEMAKPFSRSMRAWSRHAPASGNRAFDEYRAETLRRLESEFDEFQDFLEQLRQARDKQEFDQFMSSRNKTVDTTPAPKNTKPEAGGEQPEA